MSADRGLFYEHGERLYVEALWFRQAVRNDIVAVADPANPNLFRFENVFRTRTTGVESALNLRLPGGLALDAAYTRQEAVILEHDAVDPRDNGNQVPGVPEVLWSAGLHWRRAGWHAWLKTRHRGRRYVDTANTRFLEAYRLYDAGLTAPLGRGFELGLEARNLTAETYAELENHPPPGQQFFLTLRWRRGPAEPAEPPEPAR